VNRIRQSLSTLAGLILVVAASAAPPTSRAIVRGEKGLVLQTVPTPKPGAGQVLIKVYAAGVNPVDWKRQAQIPGFDVAGVIDSVGPDVRGFKPGDAVLARVDSGYAQYAVAGVDETVAKPRRFTFEQAAGVPVAGTAGYRAVEEAKIEPGQRVAIIGAAGGTGEAAVQVARSHGAKVIAVGHSSQQAFLKTLGVDEFVAFDKEDVGARVRNVDAAINLVDGQANAALGYVRRGGRFTSIAGSPSEERAVEAGVGIVVIAGATYKGISTGDALRALVKLAEKGEYTVTVSTALPLADAGNAQEIGRAGQSIGKIVLVVEPAKSKSR
jgi:NADPH:quinone reductase-like Zn-dependent oxidoreductase